MQDGWRGWAFPLWLGTILWVVSAAFSAAQAGPQTDALTLHDEALLSTAELAPGLSMLRDPSGQMSLTQARAAVAQGRSSALRSGVAAGYTDAAIWLILRVRREAPASPTWWLRLDRGFLDDVRLHHIRPDGATDAVRLAGDRNRPSGSIDYRSATFALDLTEPGVHELFVRVQTGSSMILQPALMSPAAAWHVSLRDYLSLGLILGVGIATSVLGWMSLAWLRQRLFLLFALYGSAITLVWWMSSGLVHHLAFGLVPPAADGLIASSSAVASALGVLFFGELFASGRRTPRLWRASRLIAAGCLAAALAPWMGLGSRLTPYVLASALPQVLLLLPSAWAGWRAAQPADRWAGALLVVYAFLSIWNALLALGWSQPGPLADLSGPLGTLVLLVLLIGVLLLHLRDVDRTRLAAEGRAAESEVLREGERRALEDQRQLLAMLAHEIRTPVAIIDASLQSLRLLDEAVTPERSNRHERIARAVTRMNSLLELALAQDRLDVSNWRQDCVPVDLPTFTLEAIAIVGPQAEERVRLQAHLDLPPVKADARMLRYAFINLIDNALKYSPRGSAVDIVIEDRAFEGRGGLLWTIQDHGQGIRQVDCERIFDKYYRAGESTATAGLGIGLFLVRQIVGRHQGWVHAVPSDPGQGARFESWLPFEPLAEVAP